MTALGEMITTVFLILNIAFCSLLAIMDTHGSALADGRESDVTFDMFVNVKDLGDAGKDRSENHHNARAALLFTFVGLGIYIMQFVRQVERLTAGSKREYASRWSIVMEAGLAFLFSFVAWILIIVESGAYVDYLNKAGNLIGDNKIELSIGTGWVLLLLVTFMNLFIFVRTTMLAFYANSWPSAIGSKGSFGSGSARIAEQFPVMGNA